MPEVVAHSHVIKVARDEDKRVLVHVVAELRVNLLGKVLEPCIAELLE